MPSNVVKGIAKDSGKTEDEVEQYWDDAKKEVEDQYDDVEKDSDQYYKLVTSITKKMAGIDEPVNHKSFLQLLDEERENL